MAKLLILIIALSVTVFPEGFGLQECYHCQDSCDDFTVENCLDTLGADVEAACYTADVTIGNILSLVGRGCIEADRGENLCAQANSMGAKTCTLCHTDLCNNSTQEQSNDDDNTPSTEKCFFCMDQCDKPLKQHNCAEELGEGVKAMCLSFQIITTDNITTISRGCLANDADVKLTCAAFNNYQDISCSVCHEDLCNADHKDGVQQCYSCVDRCENPAKVENCHETLGLNSVAACFSSEIVQNDDTVKITRKCVRDDEVMRNACKAVNDDDSTNSNCTVCHDDLCNYFDHGDGDNGMVEFYRASIFLVIIELISLRLT